MYFQRGIPFDIYLVQMLKKTDWIFHFVFTMILPLSKFLFKVMKMQTRPWTCQILLLPLALQQGG